MDDDNPAPFGIKKQHTSPFLYIGGLLISLLLLNIDVPYLQVADYIISFEEPYITEAVPFCLFHTEQRTENKKKLSIKNLYRHTRQGIITDQHYYLQCPQYIRYCRYQI